MGYLWAYIAQLTANFCILLVYVQFLNFFFGSCWLFTFIAEDISTDLDAFNILAQNTSDGERAELLKRFCDIVQIYSHAKKYGSKDYCNCCDR